MCDGGVYTSDRPRLWQCSCMQFEITLCGSICTSMACFCLSVVYISDCVLANVHLISFYICRISMRGKRQKDKRGCQPSTEAVSQAG